MGHFFNAPPVPPLPLTRQSAFDFVVEMMRQRGYKRATRKDGGIANGGCVYRTDEGLPCAIGGLIQDLYDPAMDKEQTNVAELCAMSPAVAERLFPLGDGFCNSLQHLHDADEQEGGFEFRAELFAQHLGLTFTPLQGASK